VFGLCIRETAVFLNQQPCSVNWNVFAHNEEYARPKPPKPLDMGRRRFVYK